MQTLRELYKIGRGPSSSHTMGPERAAKLFSSRYPEADRFTVVLYGSLSKTGAGHGTDRILRETLAPRPAEIVYSDAEGPFEHENTLDLQAYRDDICIGTMRVCSVGGGTIRVEGEAEHTPEERYAETTFHEIAEICKHRGIRLSEYVMEHEDADFHNYLHDIWQTMKLSVQQGLTTSGILPGGLGVERKAQFLYNQRHIDESPSTRENRIVCAYAFAVTEQNADGGIIVTAPTCGACGVLPAVLKYMQEKNGFSEEDILRALAVGGLIGNLVKHNASISGAECGCQAEVGTACSMASAALAELFEMGIDQIEYAAEMAMEHYLGLTCDPICGLVQIPCIERNAVAAMRAINALSLANFLSGTRKISFDVVVRTMYQTGRDMSSKYRETADGGLAAMYR
ncbi:MAG: L-serine ammonia-lyase, iron-sulfur-dependent, subunit alpha [Clostridia bacterium]|nr:L-serine ammonia-lyase, iron-sulfur-dependent, subunit alpha [Clostridia bacterium]